MKKLSIILSLFLSATICSAQKPVFFWASDPIKPNETIMAQGDNLDGETKMQICRIEDGRVSNTPLIKTYEFGKEFQTVESLQPSPQTGKYVVPESMSLGIYAIRPVKKGIVGDVKLLNAPISWWIQGDQVDYSVPNGKFSIFGKCLSYNNMAKVVLKDESGVYHTPSIKEQDMWHVEVTTKDLAEGNYQLYIHNGLGGEYGWIKAGDIAIKEREKWPTKVFNVLDYGAKPSSNPTRSRLDKTNDSPAFQKALDAAGANGGGVVFVPLGCYRLEDPINIPRYVTLKGESQIGTNLGWVDREDAHIGLVNGTNNFAVKDLSIFVQNYWSVIRGDHGHTDGAGNITVENVVIRANRQLGITSRAFPEDWKEIQVKREWDVSLREAPLNFGGKNVVVVNCDILASHNTIILDKASGVIANNKLHCPQTFQNSQYWIRGCHDLIITGNDIYGGGCMGTHNTTRGKYRTDTWECYMNATSKNIYFANNYQYDNWKWDREMMTLDSHGYDGPYIGPVAEGKGSSFTIPGSFSVLSANGIVVNKSGGALLSQKQLVEGKYYKILVKLQSKEDKVDWDRCFANYYDVNEPLERSEPAIFERNGDSRHYEHGKFSGFRIRGAKGFEIKELRVAKTWDDIRDKKGGNVIFEKTILDGTSIAQKESEILHDLDKDNTLYALLTVKAGDASKTGVVELMREDGKVGLSMGISRIGGKKVNFKGDTRRGEQSSTNINLYKGALVYVVDGKGCGQYREITGGEGSTLTIDRPWDVELDKTSVISIHRTQHHLIFSGNRFEDGGNAMLLYGGSVENILAGNTTLRSSGYSVTGLGGCATMYCQFLDNDIVSGAGFGGTPFNLRGGRISIEPYRPVGYSKGFHCVGIVVRGNKLENMASIGISGPVQNVLIERNNISNTQTGVIVDSEGMGSFQYSWYWPQDVFIRDNNYKNVDNHLKADSEATVTVVE